MPIRPENKHRYPRDWKQIRAAILDRAGHRCEQCGVPNHWYRSKMGNVVQYEWEALLWREERMIKFTRIVLTIAHLDHTPDHNDPDNLRALCQRCHLAYDADHHAQTAYRTRHAEKAIGDLFDHA